MTLSLQLPLTADHAILHGVSWDDYERVLAEIGNGRTRVTFLDGSMEIMSPLPEHDKAADVMGCLVRDLTFEVGLPICGFGSTTYRRKDMKAGLEPDNCYYIQNEPKVRSMKRFNPKIHPAPDLAIEIDVTSRSIGREPIYARLGVPELWRYSRQHIAMRLLSPDKTYHDAKASAVFPFLPMAQFEKFVQRMLVEEQNSVTRDFRKWAQTLRTS